MQDYCGSLRNTLSKNELERPHTEREGWCAGKHCGEKKTEGCLI